MGLLARGHTGRLWAERSASVEGDLLSVLRRMREDKAALLVRDIASRSVEGLGTEYDRPVSARWVGVQLRKRLSLVTVKSHGNFLMPETEYRKLELLFVRYESFPRPRGCADFGDFLNAIPENRRRNQA